MKKRAIAEKIFYFLSGGMLIILLWYHFMHLPISEFGEYEINVMNDSAEGMEVYFFYYLLLIMGVSFTIIGIAGLIKLALNAFQQKRNSISSKIEAYKKSPNRKTTKR